MKRFLAKISDIKNAMRVLEIMDECGCDIEKVTRDGLDECDYWKIIPKWYVSEKEGAPWDVYRISGCSCWTWTGPSIWTTGCSTG